MTSPAPDDRHAVLFVDDEEKARKYFRMAFARDFTVLTAGSVQEALEILELHGDDIAILITDQRMPGQQGVDLLKRARSDWPQIVRMLTTAYSDLDDAIAAVNRGEILRYITKPWDLEALRAELRHGMEFYLLRRERDLLIQEKLSVLERASQVDRLRSLLAIGAGLTHLRHVAQGLSEWARHAAAARRKEPASPAERELWGEEVRQTQDLIALHRRLRELDDEAAGGFPDLVSPSALLADHGFEPLGTAPMLQCRRTLLDRLLGALRPEVADRVRIEESSPGGMRIPGLAAVLVFEGVAGGVGIGPGLFDAYLIAWHHGGSLCQEAPDQGGHIRLVLPVDPRSATVPEPDATWIADQFSLLEN
jgi:two-component system, probable response regulator PhcQ